ncbi:HVA22-like protein k [Morus notabilis]|uniref:HVA22-like protein k n=1 Tax=Morus notabilis TaxID=981085 RepID=UPI000CED5336|nr:HVA22-like protein k [Morus notabilis]
MALLGSTITSEVGLRLLLSPLGSNVIVRTACCSVGIVLPVYSTFKAIEKKDNSEQQRWLIYWAAYGSFSLVEVFSDNLISWVPMYYHTKFAFLVWLQLPSVDGAKQLYMSHLRPFFLRHQSRIDQFLGVAYREMVKLFSSHREEIQYARAVLLKIMGSADQLLNGGNFQTRPTNAIEGQGATTSDVESDHAHDD